MELKILNAIFTYEKTKKRESNSCSKENVVAVCEKKIKKGEGGIAAADGSGITYYYDKNSFKSDGLEKDNSVTCKKNLK